MNLKKIFYGVLALTLLFAFAGCGNKAEEKVSDEDYVLKIAYNNSLCEAPIQMGVEKKFFDEEGLKYEMVKVDAAHMPEAIGSGQVEAGFGLLSKYLQPIDNGLDIKITAGIHTGCIKVLVPNDSPIKSVKDLKGKVVGTTGLGAAAPTIVTRRSLYHQGLKAAVDDCDVEFKVYGGSDLAQALQNGAVDAIANGDPQASLSEKEYNLRPIIDTATDPEYRDEYCCISFVSGDLLKNHPEVAKKFTRAMLKAAEWVEANKDETAKIQIEKNWVAGDAEFNASVLKKYSYKPSVDGALDALNLAVPDLQAIGLISKDRDAKEFIDSIFYRFDDLAGEKKADKVVKKTVEKDNMKDCCKDKEVKKEHKVVADCCS